MTSPRSAPVDRTLPLRERKKLRTRQALADAALRLFTEQGFEETTLEELVDAAEVSKRTFFRIYRSKEEVGIAAELELWQAYLAEVTDRELHGPVLTVLRDALSATVLGLGEGWIERFIATRKLIAHVPELNDRSVVSTLGVQERLVEELERKLGADSREDVRLRLLGEFVFDAWRCGARNWIAGRGEGGGGRPASGGSSKLLARRVEEAFDAIPSSLALSGP